VSLPYDEMKTPFKSKVSKAEQWARDETKTTGYSQSGYSITVPERSLSELVTLRDELTESNRQLRESVEAVEMENQRLGKEHDRLRGELEKVKAKYDNALARIAECEKETA
jgi:predicted RNase H-like nuclease (RuvC/YqgF family)